MQFLIFISNTIIPFVIFGIISYGMLTKINVYDEFITGAKNGFLTILKIMPTLIGLMIAVGILRASGFLEFLAKLLGTVTLYMGFPPQLVPLAIIKMFSSSGATSMLLDIYKEYGTDSPMGYIASIMMSSTETIFYTMSVYFIAAKVIRTRWTLLGALSATISGIIASVLLGKALC
ncbi:MAG: nucleoside recognition domain-containing protein [Lachnospiraceae bacterium]